MESAFDIDISGDDPPPGNLPSDGDYRPPEVVDAEGLLQGDEEGAGEADPNPAGDVDLGGDDAPAEGESFAREEDGDTDATSEVADVPAVSQPSDTEPPTPEDPLTPVESSEEPPEEAAKPKRQRKKATPKAKSASGTVDRIYLVFEMQKVEVDGQIVEAPIRRDFTVDGQVVHGLKARNRDLALRKAGKLFGHGYEGTLVAVPEGMWEPTPVRNKPREHYHVEVG